jgi:hypothetical protein
MNSSENEKQEIQQFIMKTCNEVDMSEITVQEFINLFYRRTVKELFLKH